MRDDQKMRSSNKVVGRQQTEYFIKISLTWVGTKDWSLSRSLMLLLVTFLPCLKMSFHAFLIRVWYALSFVWISLVRVSISDGFPILGTSAFLIRHQGQRHLPRNLIHNNNTLDQIHCIISPAIQQKIDRYTYFLGNRLNS